MAHGGAIVHIPTIERLAADVDPHDVARRDDSSVQQRGKGLLFGRVARGVRVHPQTQLKLKARCNRGWHERSGLVAVGQRVQPQHVRVALEDLKLAGNLRGRLALDLGGRSPRRRGCCS